jgi:carboxymethylenebutenolidase
MTRAARFLRGSLLVLVALTAASSGRVSAGGALAARSMLPSVSEATALLNTTHHHGEWIRVPAGAGTVLAVVTYPDRRDSAAVVVITARTQKLTPWLRAVADQVTSEGFIAVVPDALTTDAAAVSAVRQHVARHPAANGVSASITLSSTLDIDTAAEDGRFAISKAAWADAMAFLNTQSNNSRETVIAMPSHVHPPGLQAQAGRGQGPRGYPAGKLDNLPAGLFTAKNALARSTLKAEWVDIPMPGVYSGRMRTRITYPEGTGAAGIVVVMQHGPGADEWMQALGDQLSRDGFIALVPDLHTGMGRNGGGYETFNGPDDAFAANANLRPPMTTAAYKAVREYGLRLSRASGKSAALGFCMGGSNAWLLAADVPELNAAVVYYGTHPTDEAAFARIKAPVIGFFGEDDARVTSSVAAATALATKLGKTFEPHVYAHATHGFLEFQDLGGNAAATADSWSRTVAFLKQRLQ